MHDILTLEADRRAINITVNSLDVRARATRPRVPFPPRRLVPRNRPPHADARLALFSGRPIWI